MPGLLYPAYQKLYSALCSLDRFDKETNFFDNVSCLDNFFSEYRNITFAVQAQLKHTEYNHEYEKNRDKYLIDHWFIEKRNETTKQHPFRLIKKIILSVYSPHQGIAVFERDFSAKDDTPLESLFPKLKKTLSEINEAEVFFSASFSFREQSSDTDLFDKLLSGIASMQQFMEAMEQDIGEDCLLCNQIKEKIDGLSFLHMPRDFLLVNDYVYYPENNTFEKGTRFAIIPPSDGKKIANRQPLTVLTQPEYYNYNGTPFCNFTFLHAVLRYIKPGLDIMPAIMVVYEDDTFELDVFHADIKTTRYRKINETAKTIGSQNVKEVYYMSLYSVIPINERTPNTSKERIKTSTSDVLVCASIDSQLNEKEYVFDGKAMEQPEYVHHVMKNGMQNSLNLSRINMFPIWQAFKKKTEKTTSEE